MADQQTVVMESIELVYPNFQGKEGLYNRAGDRNFCVALPRGVAEAMSRDGWNVKEGKVREEGDEPRFTLEVAVSFKVRPPKIWMITSRGRTGIGETEVDLLDFVEFKNVDVILNPYSWDINGKQGIKAYLGTMFATINEDQLELKYSDVPISNS